MSAFLTVPRGGRQADRMVPAPAPEKRRLPLVPLAIAGVAAVIAGAILIKLIGWEQAVQEGKRAWKVVFDTLSGAGPGVFFAAMALLPIAGVPMSPFALSAGPLFGERLGTTTIILLGLAAITFNLTVAYWLARRWLRPLLARLVERLGYKMPQIEKGDATDLIVLLRVTPGPPFFVQNYLLGLAEVPFGRYLAISCAVQWSFNIAFMLFGDALSQGRGKMAVIAIGLLAALVAGTHLVRKHLGKKPATP
ncbi:MAG: TVP38/TMEM64 family protein [Verrucomicrobia bacterium]|nr:TVP38/TMEM64 family protein [Verrucomicrobiota bacterium]